MDIRKLKQNELDGVFDLIEEFDRARSPRPNEDQIDRIFNQLLSSGGCVLGAFDSLELVGTCTLNLCPNFSWSGRPYGILENVVVTKTQRNKGIGKLLLQKAKAIAKELDCYKLALMTGSSRTEAFGFYETVGFTGDKTGFQIRFDS